LIAPPFTVSKEAIEALSNDFKFVEADEFKADLLVKNKEDKEEEITLLYLPRLKGLGELAAYASDKVLCF